MDDSSVHGKHANCTGSDPLTVVSRTITVAMYTYIQLETGTEQSVPVSGEGLQNFKGLNTS